MNSGGWDTRIRRAVRTVMIWYIILIGARSMKGRFVNSFGGDER
jgi:hypothetical protein